MNNDAVDRLVTLAGLELSLFLWMLDAVDTRMATAMTLPLFLTLASAIGATTAGFAWWSWGRDRARTVTRGVGVLLLGTGVAIAVTNGFQNALNASIACVGAVLVAATFGRHRSGADAAGGPRWHRRPSQ